MKADKVKFEKIKRFSAAIIHGAQSSRELIEDLLANIGMILRANQIVDASLEKLLKEVYEESHKLPIENAVIQRLEEERILMDTLFEVIQAQMVIHIMNRPNNYQELIEELLYGVGALFTKEGGMRLKGFELLPTIANLMKKTVKFPIILTDMHPN
jgi:hypothetical protein